MRFSKDFYKMKLNRMCKGVWEWWIKLAQKSLKAIYFEIDNCYMVPIYILVKINGNQNI